MLAHVGVDEEQTSIKTSLLRVHMPQSQEHWSVPVRRVYVVSFHSCSQPESQITCRCIISQ